MYKDENAIKRAIRDELDKVYQKDLAELMQIPAFRRFVSYVFMDCGMRESIPLGNSKDMFNAGRRSMGIQLSHAIDSIGKPERTSGMLLRQLAEREYVELELGIRDHIVSLYSKIDKARRVTPKGKEGANNNGRTNR